MITIVLALIVLHMSWMILSMRRVRFGFAFIRSAKSETSVTFSNTFCFPFVHKGKSIDIRSRNLNVDFSDARAIQFADGVLVDLNLSIDLSIKATPEDVLLVGMKYDRGNGKTVELDTARIVHKIASLLKSVASHYSAGELQYDVSSFQNQALQQLNSFIAGFEFETLTVNRFELQDNAELELSETQSKELAAGETCLIGGDIYRNIKDVKVSRDAEPDAVALEPAG